MILRVLAYAHQGLPRRPLLCRRQKGEPRRQFEGGTAAEPRTRRQIRHRQIVESHRHPQTKRRHRREHPERIVHPTLHARLPGHAFCAQRHHTFALVAHPSALSIITLRQRNPNSAVDRRAQDRATVVVRMIADKFDPTRRAGNKLRRTAKRGAKDINKSGFHSSELPSQAHHRATVEPETAA